MRFDAWPGKSWGPGRSSRSAWYHRVIPPPESATLTQFTEQQEHALVSDPRVLPVTYRVTSDRSFPGF